MTFFFLSSCIACMYIYQEVWCVRVQLISIWADRYFILGTLYYYSNNCFRFKFNVKFSLSTESIWNMECASVEDHFLKFKTTIGVLMKVIMYNVHLPFASLTIATPATTVIYIISTSMWLLLHACLKICVIILIRSKLL